MFPRGVDEDVEEEEGVGEVSTVEKDGGVMGGEAGVREEQENHNHSHKVTAAWRLIVNLWPRRHSDTASNFHPFFWKTSRSSSVANSAVWLLHLASIQTPLARQNQLCWGAGVGCYWRHLASLPLPNEQ